MRNRRLLGQALMGLAFLLIVLLGYGVVEPFGSIAGAADLPALLRAVAPTLLIPLAVFLAGLWLIKGAPRT